jgi:hypothetical protein
MSQSHEMRLLLADNQAGATNAISLAVMGTDLIGDQIFGEDLGRRGTRQEYDCGARLLGEVVSGGFEFQPSVAQLDWLLQRCMGDAISTFPAAAVTPGETLPQFYGFVDKGPTIFRYDLLVINRITLSVREGDYLKVRVDFVGKNETSGVSWPGTPPAIACATEYVCSDVVLSLGVTAYPFKSFDLVIDNQIAPNQQENALYRTIFESEGLRISGDIVLGYRSDTTAFYRQAVAGTTLTLVMTDGTPTTYTWAFANVKIAGKGPTVPGTGEITQTPSFVAKRTASTAVLTVTKS